MANGDKLSCEGLVKEVKMNIQGMRIVMDLHVLPLVGLDVVMDNDLLKGLGKVVHDYHNIIMEFKSGSKERVWTTLASKEIKVGETIMLEKLCKGGAHCFAIVMAKEDLTYEVKKME